LLQNELSKANLIEDEHMKRLQGSWKGDGGSDDELFQPKSEKSDNSVASIQNRLSTSSLSTRSLNGVSSIGGYNGKNESGGNMDLFEDLPTKISIDKAPIYDNYLNIELFSDKGVGLSHDVVGNILQLQNEQNSGQNNEDSNNAGEVPTFSPPVLSQSPSLTLPSKLTSDIIFSTFNNLSLTESRDFLAKSTQQQLEFLLESSCPIVEQKVQISPPTNQISSTKQISPKNQIPPQNQPALPSVQKTRSPTLFRSTSDVNSRPFSRPIDKKSRSLAHLDGDKTKTSSRISPHILPAIPPPQISPTISPPQSPTLLPQSSPANAPTNEQIRDAVAQVLVLYPQNEQEEFFESFADLTPTQQYEVFLELYNIWTQRLLYQQNRANLTGQKSPKLETIPDSVKVQSTQSPLPLTTSTTAQGIHRSAKKVENRHNIKAIEPPLAVLDEILALSFVQKKNLLEELKMDRLALELDLLQAESDELLLLELEEEERLYGAKKGTEMDKKSKTINGNDAEIAALREQIGSLLGITLFLEASIILVQEYEDKLEQYNKQKAPQQTAKEATQQSLTSLSPQSNSTLEYSTSNYAPSDDDYDDDYDNDDSYTHYESSSDDSTTIVQGLPQKPNESDAKIQNNGNCQDYTNNQNTYTHFQNYPNATKNTPLDIHPNSPKIYHVHNNRQTLFGEDAFVEKMAGYYRQQQKFTKE